MGPSAESQPEFDFSGGALCLDFANTLADRPRGEKETLQGFAELLSWCAQAAVVEGDQRGSLLLEADRHPRAARAFFGRAIELRERLYRIFSTLARGEHPAAADLEALNRDLAAALQNLRVQPEGDGFAWSWAFPGKGFDWLLWPVTRSAADLLTSEEANRVSECASECCSWLFVDRSRTHRRRWCDMKVCGNRAKAQRHYRRSKRSAKA